MKLGVPIQGLSFVPQVTLERHLGGVAGVFWDSLGLALEQAPASVLVLRLALALCETMPSAGSSPGSRAALSQAVVLIPGPALAPVLALAPATMTPVLAPGEALAATAAHPLGCSRPQ